MKCQILNLRKKMIISLSSAEFTHSMASVNIWANSADNKLVIFLLFPQKTGFGILRKTGYDIICKLSLSKTICMKCQILFFFGKKKRFQNVVR